MENYAEQQKAQTREIIDQKYNLFSEHITFDEEWKKLAECKGLNTEIFYPSDGLGVIAAKKICAMCVVKQNCLDYAIKHQHISGVWGGASERDRKRIVKNRQKGS